jgi:nucleoside phosphorylase
VGLLVALVAAAFPTAVRAEDGCGPQALVLAAMPLELEPLLAEATIERTTTIDGRTFHTGTLAGRDVVLAMTGIGMENARITTELAYETTECPFTSTLFSGVAGSIHRIGDVAVPVSWTDGEGGRWRADRRMLDAATAVAEAGTVELSDTVPVGDAACACPPGPYEDPGTPVTMPHDTTLHVGGEGISGDMFSGRAVPCLPGGGDVAGCSPCLPGAAPEQAAAFAENAPPLLETEFVQGMLQQPPVTTDRYTAQDMETAATAAVARDHKVPFLGIRAVSDGQGDPLHLPGFPWQFFTYRHLAGDNAAAVTIAVLQELPAELA